MIESSNTHFLESQNEIGEDEKIQAGNVQIVLLVIALVQDPMASWVQLVCVKEFILPGPLANQKQY